MPHALHLPVSTGSYDRQTRQSLNLGLCKKCNSFYVIYFTNSHLFLIKWNICFELILPIYLISPKYPPETSFLNHIGMIFAYIR